MGDILSFLLGLFGIGAQYDQINSQEQMHREDNQFNAEQSELSRQFQADQSEISRLFNAEEAMKQRNWSSMEASLNRSFQSKESQIARDFQERFYQQYQSPEAMIRQYKSAGLNPALLQGGVQSSPVSSSVPSGSMPSGASASSSSAVGAAATAAQFKPIFNIMDSFIRLAKISSEVDLIKSESSRNKADVSLRSEETRALQIQNYISERTKEFTIDSAEANLNKLRNEVSKVALEVNELGFQVTTQDLRKGLLIAEKALKNAESKKMSSEAYMKKLEADFYKNKGWETPPSVLVPIISASIIGGSSLVSNIISKIPLRSKSKIDSWM